MNALTFAEGKRWCAILTHTIKKDDEPIPSIYFRIWCPHEWACSSAGRAPALQESRQNQTSAASGVAYAEPCGATDLLNWTDVGPIWPVWSWRLRMSGAALHFGGKEYPLRGAILKVYTPAKTLAACFKFRNKIGLDLALEALRECRHLKKPSIDELWPGIETEGRSIGSTERVEHVHHYLSADSPHHASRPA
jgi:hypothetical protein